jgi:hypothetical protein
LVFSFDLFRDHFLVVGVRVPILFCPLGEIFFNLEAPVLPTTTAAGVVAPPGGEVPRPPPEEALSLPFDLRELDASSTEPTTFFKEPFVVALKEPRVFPKEPAALVTLESPPDETLDDFAP